MVFHQKWVFFQQCALQLDAGWGYDSSNFLVGGCKYFDVPPRMGGLSQFTNMFWICWRHKPFIVAAQIAINSRKIFMSRCSLSTSFNIRGLFENGTCTPHLTGMNKVGEFLINHGMERGLTRNRVLRYTPQMTIFTWKTVIESQFIGRTFFFRTSNILRHPHSSPLISSHYHHY